MNQDAGIIFGWWLTWLGVGLAGWPIARIFFAKWEDQGYVMGKIIGLAGASYLIWWLGSLKILPFGRLACLLGVIATGIFGWKLTGRDWKNLPWKTILLEEAGFAGLLFFWSWIKAHEPAISGLEKLMDYGFMRSILRTTYFPPADMWFSGQTINYYYFGHLMVAFLTKLSGINLAYTFNLMLGTILALGATMSFVIGRELMKNLSRAWKIGGAILIAFLVTWSGNMQTIYAFTKGYWADTPPPFWKIWSDFSDWKKVEEGWRGYWYPNATRFIPYTIHEFPSYSFVVSDIHGHVLSIPLVLLAIALLVNIFKRKSGDIDWWEAVVFGTVAGMAFMTNALDGPIYVGLFAILILARSFRVQPLRDFTLQSIINIPKTIRLINLRKTVLSLGITLSAFVITVLPFISNFKSFVSGIAVNCPPKELANTKFGPIMFDGVEKCQKSPLWMILLLWGFFAYCAIGLGVSRPKEDEIITRRMLILWSVFCTALIIFPEFFYFKDIYPMHFRSNTMFKLGYQVFIMMSILAGYTIVQILAAKRSMFKIIFVTGVIPMLFLVSIYPYFGVRGYFGDLKIYRGLYGLNWMQERLPDDLAAINWINKNIPDTQQPVILEAPGDSYTDYERFSVFTGLPTVAGWAVHEWLWRGSYEPIGARIEEVRQIYEAKTAYQAETVLNKYNVEYIIVGGLERVKFPLLNEEVIKQVATPVFTSGTTTVYKTD